MIAIYRSLFLSMQGDSGAVLARRGGVGGPLGVHPGAGRGGGALGGQAHHAPLQRHALLPPQGPRTHRPPGQSVDLLARFHDH